MRSPIRALALCLSLAATACSSGTFVVVTIDRAPSVPDGQITKLEATVGFGGRTVAAPALTEGGGPIRFPTDAAFKIANASGPFTVQVIGKDAAGTTLARGTVSGTVAPDATARVSVTLQAIAPAMLVADATQLAFAEPVVVGSMGSPVTVMVTNAGAAKTGPLEVAVSGQDFTASGCQGATLEGGEGCALSLVFTPKDKGERTGTVTVTATPGGSVAIAVSGTALAPAVLYLDPPTALYNPQVVGATETITFTITNDGEAPSGPLDLLLDGASKSEFQIVSAQDQCTGRSLAAGTSCTLDIAFTPASTGGKSATLTATASPGGSAQSTLSGTGVTTAGLAFDSTSRSFGTVTKGSTSPAATFTLSNGGTQTTGTVSTTVTGANPADFTLTDNCKGKALGAACTYVVAFAPTSFGSKTATVTASATPGGSASFLVTGTGQDSVALTVSPTPMNGNISGGGLNCGLGGATCTTGVTRTTSAPNVTLTAAPATGYTLKGWTGDCAMAGTATCTVAMSAARTVSALFAPRPVLAYTFDGNTTNSGTTSPGYDLAVMGTSSYLAAGKVGQAMALGAGAYGLVAGAKAFLGTLPKVTIAFWMYTNTVPMNAILDCWNRTAAPYGGIQFYYSDATHFSVCAASTSATYLGGGCKTFTAPAVTAAWHHIAFTYDGTGTGAGQGAPLLVYVDGVLMLTIANDASNNPIFSSAISDTLYLGVGGLTLDDFKIFNQAFTPAQLCTLVIGGTVSGTGCTLP